MTGITEFGHCDIHGGYLFTKSCVRCRMEVAEKKIRRERLVEAGLLKAEDELPEKLTHEMDDCLMRLYRTDVLLSESSK